MKILIINGPNLNLLGTREPEVYGSESFESYFETLQNQFNTMQLSYYQSNIEGELISKLQEVGFTFDGIIINAGAYTHTSVAIRDAVSGISIPVVEVHISNPQARESFRRTSLLAEVISGSISGFGFESYMLALIWFARRNNEKQ